MRAYVPITPSEIQSFFISGSLHVAQALSVVQGSSLDFEADPASQEEEEFELSWEAATESRELQGSAAANGYVLAVELLQEQLGQVHDSHVVLLSDILWTQVQSLLLAESEEEELSWFAVQEIPTYLPQWLA
jgi:hypothetical protein